MGFGTSISPVSNMTSFKLGKFAGIHGHHPSATSLGNKAFFRDYQAPSGLSKAGYFREVSPPTRATITSLCVQYHLGTVPSAGPTQLEDDYDSSELPNELVQIFEWFQLHYINLYFQNSHAHPPNILTRAAAAVLWWSPLCCVVHGFSRPCRSRSFMMTSSAEDVLFFSYRQPCTCQHKRGLIPLLRGHWQNCVTMRGSPLHHVYSLTFQHRNGGMPCPCISQDLFYRHHGGIIQFYNVLQGISWGSTHLFQCLLSLKELSL